MQNIIWRYIPGFTLMLLSFVLNGQGIKTKYGKNRVQYQKFDWKEYNSPNFTTYWYDGGDDLGKYVVQVAEQEYPNLQNILEYKVNNKIKIIVYNDLSDFHQTNIGQEVPFYNTSGITKIIGNKVYLYFNGNHRDFQRQIKEGIAMVSLNQMMFGDSFQEIVQNAVLLNLPEWYTKGLVAYIGQNWSQEADDKLKDGILSEKYKTYMDVVKDDPVLAGHSLWYFISNNYGKSTVSNLLYLTRINRSVESGFLYVLGSSFIQTTDSWLQFYAQRYSREAANTYLPKEEGLNSGSPNSVLTEAKLNKQGNQLAYVKNINGRYDIIIRNLKEESEKTVFKGGFRNTVLEPDLHYPLITWSGNNLIIISEKSGKIKLSKYSNGALTSKSLDKQFSRFYSIDAVSGKQLIVSALRNGQVDLFLMNTGGGNPKRITNDVYDDVNPIGITLNGEKGVLFASNRESEQMEYWTPARMDLYFLNLEQPSAEIVRVTDTPFANEHHPIKIGDNQFGFISDENGVSNRYIGALEKKVLYNEKVITQINGKTTTVNEEEVIPIPKDQIDTIILQPVYGLVANTYAATNYQQGIISQSHVSLAGTTAEVIRNKGKQQLYLTQVTTDQPVTLKSTNYRTSLKPKKKLVKETNVVDRIIKEKKKRKKIKEQEIPKPEPENQEQEKKEEIDVDNYYFQSEFDEEETPPNNQKPKTEEKEQVAIDDIELPKPQRAKKKKKKQIYSVDDNNIKPYRAEFKTEFLTFQVDNGILFEIMDIYSKNTFRFGDVTLSSKTQDGSGLYRYNPVGAMITGSITDVMENHRFQGGLRLPFTLEGMEYFLVYENRKNRLNKELFYYRRSNEMPFRETNGPPIGSRLITNYAGAVLNYPINLFSSIRVTPTIRNDKNTLLASEYMILGASPIVQQRAGVKTEFIFDNTKNISLNIVNGSRFKVFYDVQKEFTARLGSESQFGVNKGLMNILGVDARQYTPINRHTVFATRVAGATSFGREKVLYYLGGVDNWALPLGREYKTNSEIPVTSNGNFAFQTLATNLRGFKNNIRNGNSYLVGNMELRIALINYLSRTPVKSAFLRNFQVVPFFDVGTAWEGKSPWSKENPLNTVLIDDPNKPISVKVNYFRNPIVYGYGAGVRSLLFGYFVRVDMGWGVETGILQQPILYVSLGKDF